jgi:outer membrane receptor protein involved in Fe transport
VYWKDSLLVRRGTIGAETPTMLHIGVTIDAGDWLTLQAGIFRRDVDHALLFVQDSTAFGTSATGLYAARTQRTDGVTVAATLRWGPFALTGTAAYLHTTVDEAEKLLVPQYSFGTEATYQNRFFGGALDIKLGSRLRFTDRFHGTTFVPSAQIFPEDTKYLLGRTTALDAFLVFRIGDAHVSLAMDNILNANQLDVIFYPLPKRHIRLGVNWSFFN